MAVGIRHTDHVASSIRKSWHQLRRQAAVARGIRPWSLVFLYTQPSGNVVALQDPLATTVVETVSVQYLINHDDLVHSNTV
jgi:hypothetical protein